MRKCVLVIFASALLAACGDPAADPSNVKKISGGSERCYRDITDYENGILYFPCTSNAFANTLSRYRKEHPNLQIVSVTSNNTGGHGVTKGYFIVTKP